jgi:hypothetical protein
MYKFLKLFYPGKKYSRQYFSPNCIAKSNMINFNKHFIIFLIGCYGTSLETNNSKTF